MAQRPAHRNIAPSRGVRPRGPRRTARGVAIALLTALLVAALGPFAAPSRAWAQAQSGPPPGGDAVPATAPDLATAPPPWMALPWPLATRDLDGAPAKFLFGRVPTPSAGATEAIGFYAKGCLAGAVPLPIDGPTWQVMRLSRNRHWGTPELVGYLQRLADLSHQAGWAGLLVGDMSQPRGGPMPTGHASHQIGLDVDLWYQPMPPRRLTADERETLSATSVLQPGTRDLDPAAWTPALSTLIRIAASDSQVERLFVHPAIKEQLCRTATGDRTWLNRVRPYWGHDDHFHVRLKCPPGMASCRPQAPVPPGEGCGADLAWWRSDAPWQPAPPAKTPPPPPLLAAYPAECRVVLAAPDRS